MVSINRYDRLVLECYQLDMEDRFKLAKELLRSAEGLKISALVAERISSIELAIQETFGIIKIPTTKSRNRVYVDARMFLAEQLRREGLSMTRIGFFISRDHSTVSYLCARMKDILNYPDANKDLIEKWNRFQKIIKEDDNASGVTTTSPEKNMQRII